MFNTAFLVVLYNKTLADSNTLRAIAQADVDLAGGKLVIWNNGPAGLTERDVTAFQAKGLEVAIVETIGNISLAGIYDQFMQNFPAERYVLLDHDSSIDREYLSGVARVQADELGVPLIHAAGAIRYPTRAGIPCGPQFGRVFDDTHVVNSIGSGLVLGQGLVETLRQQYGQPFDERFFLYGVDTTFFRRIRASLLTSHIRLIPGFEHSLSKLEAESEALRRFRKKERSYDLGLTLRFYERFPTNILNFAKVSVGHVKRKLLGIPTNIQYPDYVRAVFGGRHYRNSAR